MQSNLIFLIILILFILNTSSQRISVKKCEEYTNLYRQEREDNIFGTKEYDELKCPKFTLREVVGGRDAYPYEYPSVVSLIKIRDDKSFTICGGTLISEDFVLTAAHCLINGNPDKISLGEINLTPSKFSSRRRDLGITKIIIHPEYKPPSSYNDIALIQLDKKISLQFGERPAIRPACLAQSIITSGTSTTAAGWGKTSAFGDVSDKLQIVEIPVIEPSACSDFYRDALDFNIKFPGIQDKESWLIPDTYICAGADGRDTCQGDSGGPLFIVENKKFPCINYIAGITCFGATHCGLSTPGIYTKVSSYLDWIESHVWANKRSMKL